MLKASALVGWVFALAGIALPLDSDSNGSSPTPTWRPVVMLHGMGATADTLDRCVNMTKARYPGIYVHNLNVYSGKPSETTHMYEQLEAVAKAIRADPKLKNGFNFYGESQGALAARAYVNIYNDPPVHNLVALNGPQAGVGMCPHVEASWIRNLCPDLGTTLQIYKWPACSFCSYWKDPRKESDYVKNSQWLKYVNNDIQHNEFGGSKKFRERMLSLNKYMATVASDDQVVQPKESAHHRFYQWGDSSRKNITAFEQMEGYLDDRIGLKTLYTRGDMIMNEFQGKHTDYPIDWWMDNILPMFNTTV